MRLVAVVRDLLEARKVAESYEMRGFKVKIVEKKQGFLAVYEVWVEKEGGREIDVFKSA